RQSGGSETTSRASSSTLNASASWPTLGSYNRPCLPLESSSLMASASTRTCLQVASSCFSYPATAINSSASQRKSSQSLAPFSSRKVRPRKPCGLPATTSSTSI